MRNKNSISLRGLALTMFLLLAAGAVSAQVDQRFAHAQQANALALRKFEWKARTEVLKDGDTKRVQVALMRYDSNGNLQKTIVSSTPEPDLPKFGLRKAIANKKLDDFRDKLEALGALAKSYSDLPPENMQRFITNATVIPEMTEQQKLVRIEGRDVLHAGDAMTIWIDALSRRQRRAEIVTNLDGRLVRIVSEFQDLPRGGPTYAAQTRLNYDGNSIVVITNNFDYATVQF